MAFFHALRRCAARLRLDRRGATVVEYALIIGLIVLAILASLGSVAGVTINMWGHVKTRIVDGQ